MPSLSRDCALAWGASASDLFAVSGVISAEIGGGADPGHEFDVAGGVSVLSAMQYIPSGTTGENRFILLNQYSDTAHTTIGAVDLYGAGASSIYYDDIVIAPL